MEKQIDGSLDCKVAEVLFDSKGPGRREEVRSSSFSRGIAMQTKESVAQTSGTSMVSGVEPSSGKTARLALCLQPGVFHRKTLWVFFVVFLTSRNVTKPKTCLLKVGQNQGRAGTKVLKNEISFFRVVD